VRGVTKKFGARTVVNDIAMQVRPGEIYGFLGPNGSGKTTTIGMLAGIITPTAGRISLFGGGSSARELHRARRRIGATLESPNFYPYLSAFDNLRIAANVKHKDRTEIAQVLEAVGLTERQQGLFQTYSLGMKQRLALASAMLGDPELIILDEPANGLDPEGMREIREIIKGLAARGKTVFLSSHLLWEVERTCTHAAVIKHGRIVGQGSVEALTAGGARVELRATDLARLEAIVGEFPGVVSVTLEGDTVLAEVKTDDTAALNRFVAERGVYLSHLAVRQRSLEDAFLDLMGAESHTMGSVS
jgi:ABC-2 type transport system ATP-binding protein